MSVRVPNVSADMRGVRVAVTVDGRRWRRVDRAKDIADATADDRVFVVDERTGAVWFGDGRHGARPPAGALIRVSYRSGGGSSGGVAVSWSGTWPPRKLAFAAALTPSIVGECSQ